MSDPKELAAKAFLKYLQTPIDRKKLLQEILAHTLAGAGSGAVGGGLYGGFVAEPGEKTRGVLRGVLAGAGLGALGGTLGRAAGQTFGKEIEQLATKNWVAKGTGAALGADIGRSVGAAAGGSAGGRWAVKKEEKPETTTKLREKKGEVKMSNSASGDGEDVLFNNVYLPAFVTKCAQAGITFPDQESLSDALETTALIRQMEHAQNGNVIKSAAANLRAALGVDKIQAAERQDEAAKQAASALSKEATIRQAVMGILAAQS